MIRRPGTTLIEVLVAIFVMAIGLLALLALFPLGAMQMAQAIKDDRTATCAANAATLANALNLRHDPLITVAFDNPNPAAATHIKASAAATAATGNHPWADGPSYPVYVDPAGSMSFLSPYANMPPNFTVGWVAGVAPPPVGLYPLPPGWYGIPRRNVTWIASLPTAAQQQLVALQALTLTDDIAFDNNGLPRMIGANQFERDLAFSFAYLLRRPRMSQPSVVEMSVIVYQRRPLSLNGPALGGIGNASSETMMTVVSFPNPPYQPANPPRSVTLAPPPNVPLPAIRPGSWLLDCSPGPVIAGKSTPGSARFYRVVGVTESGVGQVDVEVDNPLLPGVLPPVTPGAQPPAPTIFAVMEGVAEVFDKGTSWTP